MLVNSRLLSATKIIVDVGRLQRPAVHGGLQVRSLALLSPCGGELAWRVLRRDVRGRRCRWAASVRPLGNPIPGDHGRSSTMCDKCRLLRAPPGPVERPAETDPRFALMDHSMAYLFSAALRAVAVLGVADHLTQ